MSSTRAYRGSKEGKEERCSLYFVPIYRSFTIVSFMCNSSLPRVPYKIVKNLLFRAIVDLVFIRSPVALKHSFIFPQSLHRGSQLLCQLLLVCMDCREYELAITLKQLFSFEAYLKWCKFLQLAPHRRTRSVSETQPSEWRASNECNSNRPPA